MHWQRNVKSFLHFFPIPSQEDQSSKFFNESAETFQTEIEIHVKLSVEIFSLLQASIQNQGFLPNNSADIIFESG